MNTAGLTLTIVRRLCAALKRMQPKAFCKSAPHLLQPSRVLTRVVFP